MVVLRFGSDALWRGCSDPAHMRHRWGAERARCVNRRLQQLEAMTTLDDLAFMPFDWQERSDGMIEVAVDDETSIFVKRSDRLQEDGPLRSTATIAAIGARTVGAR